MELYQAEWCPFSSAVRERCTELGVSYVARQVEARREDRDELRRVAGTDEIPTLVLDDGTAISETDEIIAYLDEHFPEGPEAARHRAQLRAHER